MTGKRRQFSWAGLAALAMIAVPSVHAANDYPTEAVADYVYVCMKANGETKEMLTHCACAIDVISSLLTYDQYVEAETAKRMAQLPGEKGSLFRSISPAKKFVAALRKAEVEAEIRCF